MPIEQFSSINDVMERLRAETPTNPLGTDPNRDQHEWVNWGDEDGGRIMPSLNSSFTSQYLYRGQTRRYQPCLPALYRGFPLVKHPRELREEHRDFYLLNQIRREEFFSVLQHHPAVGLAREIGLHLSFAALAQHYGIATDYLDVTQDPEVAAFFATCTACADGEWEPAANGVGIIYRFDLTVFPTVLGPEIVDEFFRCVELVGLQTLPRPGEQKAWSFHLPLGFDFERLPLDVFVFRHSDEAGGAILDTFEDGATLFPRDVLAETATAIQSSGSVPSSLTKKVLTDLNCSPEMMDEALDIYHGKFRSGFGIEIKDRQPIALSSEQASVALAVVGRKRDDFLQNVGVRAIRTKDARKGKPAQT